MKGQPFFLTLDVRHQLYPHTHTDPQTHSSLPPQAVRVPKFSWCKSLFARAYSDPHCSLDCNKHFTERAIKHMLRIIERNIICNFLKNTLEEDLKDCSYRNWMVRRCPTKQATMKT